MGICLGIVSVYFFEGPDTSQVQFFTLQTLFSAAGATTAVFTVTSVLHGFFPRVSARWFALAFSWLLTLLGISVGHQGWTPANILLAVINGFVIYAAAVGVNNVATSTPPSTGGVGAQSAETGRSYRWWP